MRFDWDPRKDATNKRKHGIDFNEASSLFESGAEYLEIPDDSSPTEERFIAEGPVARGVIVVVFTERDGDIIRIISVRAATTGEIDLYHQHMETQ